MIILVNDDNSLTISVRQKIIQNSKNIDEFRFLVKPIYNDINMEDLSVVLTYILPISKERKTITLTKSEELYKERLEYKILLNNNENNITSEYGDMKLWLKFIKEDEIVRYTTPTIVTIYPSESNDILPEVPTKTPTVDNLYLDKETNSFYLTSNGEAVGGAISINELSEAIVDSSNDGLVTVITE